MDTRPGTSKFTPVLGGYMGFMAYGLESRVYRAYNIGFIGLIVLLGVIGFTSP